MEFDTYIEKMSDEIIKTTQELVKIKSVESDPVKGGPFGKGVKDCLKRTLEICESMGFKTKNIDGYAGYAEMGSGEDLIGILVHLDVVPEGAGWTYNPYSGEIIEGKIYGRGTSDNKGPAVSVIYALRLLKDLNVDFKKRVRIIFGCNEESGWKGIKYYLQKEEKPCCGFTPDGLFPIVNREKGILQVQLIKDFKDDGNGNPIKFISLKGGLRPNMVPDYCECKIRISDQTHERVKNIIDKYRYKDDMDVEFDNDICIIKSRGISVASSIPENGKNAITRLLGMIGEIPFAQFSIREFIRFIKNNIGEQLNGKTLGIQMEDDISGTLTLNLGMADIDKKRGCITLDIRYPVKRREKEIINQLKKKVEMTGIVLKRLDGKAPLYVPEDNFMIKILSKAYEEVTGTEAELLSIGGGTYARAMDNVVAFGGLFPGRQILAHQKDEFLYIEDLIKMTKIYTNAIKVLVE